MATVGGDRYATCPCCRVTHPLASDVDSSDGERRNTTTSDGKRRRRGRRRDPLTCTACLAKGDFRRSRHATERCLGVLAAQHFEATGTRAAILSSLLAGRDLSTAPPPAPSTSRAVVKRLEAIATESYASKQKRLSKLRGERQGRLIRVERLLQQAMFQPAPAALDLTRAQQRVSALRALLADRELALSADTDLLEAVRARNQARRERAAAWPQIGDLADCKARLESDLAQQREQRDLAVRQTLSEESTGLRQQRIQQCMVLFRVSQLSIMGCRLPDTGDFVSAYVDQPLETKRGVALLLHLLRVIAESCLDVPLPFALALDAVDALPDAPASVTRQHEALLRSVIGHMNYDLCHMFQQDGMDIKGLQPAAGFHFATLPCLIRCVDSTVNPALGSARPHPDPRSIAEIIAAPLGGEFVMVEPTAALDVPH